MIMPAFFAAHSIALFAMNFILVTDDTDFGDLGKLMLGGFVLAVAVAVAFTFIRLRLRDKKRAAPAEFISINSYQKEK
jgi:hypothetical protein